MFINLDTLTKDPHFPKIIPLVMPPAKTMRERYKNFFTYRRMFRCSEHYIVWCELLQLWIFIPHGFRYDGASVPKFLNSVYEPTGMLFYGAAPHDFGYRFNGLLLVDPADGGVYFKNLSKSQLDNIFESMCRTESHLVIGSFIAKLGVMFGAGSVWRHFESDGIECLDLYQGLVDNQNTYNYWFKPEKHGRV